MWTRTRRRVVEEEVTEIVSDDFDIEAWREREERQRRKQRERMKYEHNRLHSFDSWWLHKYKLDVSDAQCLAKAGFYSRFGDTECFSCGLSKHVTFWKEGPDPETVHRQESPDCEFITGQSDNVSIERWMRSEQNRLDSFPPWWLDKYKLDVSVAQRLAKAGFYRWVSYTECFSCGLSKPWTFWQEGHDPETVHREESPDCKFITGQSDNVPIERWMTYEQNRLDSFPSGWLNVAQRVAKAGFYCTYTGDTKCFSCGLYKHSSLWQTGHDPETVHREERPDCKFITGQSGNVPIDNKLQENSKTSTDTSDTRVSGPSRFPISKSSKSQQNQEVRQPNDNQPKLHSGIQHLEPDTGAKPKRIGENNESETKSSTRRPTELRKSELKERKAQYVEENTTSASSDANKPIARKEWFTLYTRGSWCASKETVQTATERPVTGQEHVTHKNLNRGTDKQPENVSSYIREILFFMDD